MAITVSMDVHNIEIMASTSKIIWEQVSSVPDLIVTGMEEPVGVCAIMPVIMGQETIRVSVGATTQPLGTLLNPSLKSCGFNDNDPDNDRARLKQQTLTL
jgi:hypothetical protein